MKLGEINIGEVYEYLGGRYTVAPVKVLEETVRQIGGRSYKGFMAAFDPASWDEAEELPTEPFPVWPKQLRRPWVKPTRTMQIPLEGEDVFLLTELAFRWDTSPQEALRRALREAHERL